MEGRELYRFGEFTLDVEDRRLSHDSSTVPLAPKAHDLLVALVRRAGRLVTKRELLDLVWPDAFVEEGILSVHVSGLRKALGETNGSPSYIETVPRSGYRFIAAVTASARELRTVAVLPAHPVSASATTDDRALGLAIADALIDALGTFRGVVVRPLRAVHGYVNATGNLVDVARSLQVDAIVASSYTRNAEGLEVSARLVRAADGACLWSGDVTETPGSGGLALSTAIASAVATTLGLDGAVESGTHRDIRAVPPLGNLFTRSTDPRVYELLGRGRLQILSASILDVSKAIEAYRSAIEIDPTYAPAHAGLALAHCAAVEARAVSPADGYRGARTSALRALAMDDRTADAQVALGAVLFLGEWDWTAAERSFVRALELNPNHTEAYLLYGRLLEALDRLDDGLAMKFKALERDPVSPLVHVQIAMSYWHQRRYDEAIEWANKTLALDPKHLTAREQVASAYLKKGDLERHVQESMRHAESFGVPESVLAPIKDAYATGGRAAVVRHVLAQLPQHAPAMQLALFSGEAGDLDAAFLHLNRAIDTRDPCLVHLAVAPQWDDLRGDPRFAECLARMGLRMTPGSITALAARPAPASPPTDRC
jgi:DNA-binding winged helix-turn-helix (wHTH) protein/tetratricopeptide (TPR) repeat protein